MFLAATTTALLLLITLTAYAQDNLLTNGGLEQGEFGPYTGRGRGDLTIPAAWNVWLGQGSTDDDNFFNRGDRVYSFPHTGPGPDVVEAQLALNLNGGFVQFNAAIYQTVAVPEGTNVRAEAALQIKVCDTESGGPGFCSSDPSSGGQVRVGIDPNGGVDPQSGGILWSPWITPHDTWQRTSVDATSNGSVTVFVYATQDKPYTNNQVWIDDVKLTAEGGGGEAPAEEGEDGGTANVAPPPPPDTVPFVNPQGADDEGRIVHTVQQGDTLDSIAVAYGLTRDDLVARNPSLGSIRFLQIGQQIVIQEGGTSSNEEEAAPPPAEEEISEEEVDAMLDIVLNDDPKGLNEDDTAEEVAAPPPAASGPTAVNLFFGLLRSTFDGEADTETSAVAAAEEVAAAPTAEETVEEVVAEPTEEEAVAVEPTVAPTAEEEAVVIEPTEEPAADRETIDTGAVGAFLNSLGGGSDDAETAAAPTEETMEGAAPEPTAVAAAGDAAPVVQPEVEPQVDVASATVAVCVSMFEDINQNRLREDNEALLSGGTVVLTRDGAEAANYTTDGASEPHCLTDLEVGEYVANVTAPDGYGLTTPAQLRLPLTAGAALNIEFGAAQGVAVAVAPPPDAPADLGNSADAVLPAETPSLTDNLLAISGIVVAVLAGVVVLAGVGAAFLLRRTS